MSIWYGRVIKQKKRKSGERFVAHTRLGYNFEFRVPRKMPVTLIQKSWGGIVLLFFVFSRVDMITVNSMIKGVRAGA